MQACKSDLEIIRIGRNLPFNCCPFVLIHFVSDKPFLICWTYVFFFVATNQCLPRNRIELQSLFKKKIFTIGTKTWSKCSPCCPTCCSSSWSTRIQWSTEWWFGRLFCAMGGLLQIYWKSERSWSYWGSNETEGKKMSNNWN